MKKSILILTCILNMIILNANAQTCQWAKRGGYDCNEWGTSVCADNMGSIYVTGDFCDSISFDTITLHNANFDNIFISKYDTNGNVIWARNVIPYNIPTEGVNSYGICVDNFGSFYVTGYFSSDSISFDSIKLYNNNVPWQNIFLAKFNANGNVIWVKNIGSITNSLSTSICCDANGNVFIGAEFRSPSLTLGSITLLNDYSPINDAFIAKYDSAGNILWAKNARNVNRNGSFSKQVNCDRWGNIYFTGTFECDSISFGSITLHNGNHGNDYSNFFIIKMDPNGNELWAKSSNCRFIDQSGGISTDYNGNVYYGGCFFNDSISLGNITLYNHGLIDPFLVKYDSSGNVHWARNATGHGEGEVMNISTDNYGNTYLSGRYRDTIYFGSYLLPSIPIGTNYSIFIVKYDAQGNVSWVKSTGENDVNEGSWINADNFGNIYVTGIFQSASINFDNFTLSNYNIGNSDYFIAKLHDNTERAGIMDIASHINGISIFPNPTTSTLTIHQDTYSPNQQIIITDVLGNKVYSQAL
ncbi:MAG: hypothetical protein WCL14_05120, partial [Bacteroidota bacterium]